METHEELPYSLVIGSLLVVLVMSFVVTRVLTGTCRSYLISNNLCFIKSSTSAYYVYTIVDTSTAQFDFDLPLLNLEIKFNANYAGRFFDRL